MLIFFEFSFLKKLVFINNITMKVRERIMNENLHRVIGIDLGTTYSAVSVFNNYQEQAIIIKDKIEGDSPTTPSVVSLDRRLNKAIVGTIAKRNLALEEDNTIIEIKREMGEEFRPETLDKFKAHGTFKVDDPVKARFAGQWLSPQEVSALILMKMKEIAEGEIGEEIYDAVVTVPAYFTEKQKKATKEAALMAGLYPRQLIPEPTAAAICYGVDKYEEERKVYLVFDLGGGTFDVSIIEVEANKIDVIATSGDPRLGGSDFDDLITEWAVEELLKNYKIDVRTNRTAKAQIKLQTEQAKIRLSTHSSTNLSLVELNPQNPPSLTLERTKLEELIYKILKKSLNYVEIALKSALDKKGVEREQIDAILLVGGSTKIPKIKEMLLDYFEKDESFIRSELNPDEVVARGAAIMAFRFAPSSSFDITRKDETTLMNVDAIDQPDVHLITEHSLGLEIQDKQFSKIVDQASSIPIELKRGDYTNAGPAEFIEVRIYQGEGEYVYENTYVGTLKLGPMKPEQAGHHQFEVTYKLDENGLLHATVHHINEGKTYNDTYEHKTGVGGEKALEAMRNKLFQLFAKQSEIETNIPVTEISEPPPSPESIDIQEESISPSEKANTTQSSTQKEKDSKINMDIEVEIQPNDIWEINVEVTEEYRSLIRRVKKQLIKTPDVKLLKDYNSFVTAINESKPDDELVDLYDDLQDSYLIAKMRKY